MSDLAESRKRKAPEETIVLSDEKQPSNATTSASSSQRPTKKFKGKNRRSKHWDELNILEQSNDGKVKRVSCKSCGKTFVCNQGQLGGSITRHLNTHKGESSTIDAFVSKSSVEVPGNKEERDSALVRLIVEANLPYSIVERPAFVNYVKTLNPTASRELPSRHTISRRVVEEADAWKQELKSFLKSNDVKVMNHYNIILTNDPQGFNLTRRMDCNVSIIFRHHRFHSRSRIRVARQASLWFL